jgi:hypothetical protein
MRQKAISGSWEYHHNGMPEIDFTRVADEPK